LVDDILGFLVVSRDNHEILFSLGKKRNSFCMVDDRMVLKILQLLVDCVPLPGQGAHIGIGQLEK
jgi:hypothetical protein